MAANRCENLYHSVHREHYHPRIYWRSGTPWPCKGDYNHVRNVFMYRVFKMAVPKYIKKKTRKEWDCGQKGNKQQMFGACG